MQSVSGGGHWGGGMFINAWDMARFGYLYLRGGAWAGRQVVDPAWIAASSRGSAVIPEKSAETPLSPCPVIRI
jgi:CubicO group peptidase (beta-lactamase class C family)